MTSINNQIPPSFPQPQIKDASAQSFNRAISHQKTRGDTARTFESMLGKPDSPKNTDAQRSDESVKAVLGRSSDGGGKGQKTTRQFSQLLELLQRLAQLVQQLQARSEAKPDVANTQPVAGIESSIQPQSSNQPIPVESGNGTGAKNPDGLPPSSDTPNIPAEALDFPIDPDDLSSSNQPVDKVDSVSKPPVEPPTNATEQPDLSNPPASVDSTQEKEVDNPKQDKPLQLQLTERQTDILKEKLIPQREGVSGSVRIFDSNGA